MLKRNGYKFLKNVEEQDLSADYTDCSDFSGENIIDPSYDDRLFRSRILYNEHLKHKNKN